VGFRTVADMILDPEFQVHFLDRVSLETAFEALPELSNRGKLEVINATTLRVEYEPPVTGVDTDMTS